jgi:uncharacterized protein (DUF927 family)
VMEGGGASYTFNNLLRSDGDTAKRGGRTDPLMTVTQFDLITWIIYAGGRTIRTETIFDQSSGLERGIVATHQLRCFSFQLLLGANHRTPRTSLAEYKRTMRRS